MIVKCAVCGKEFDVLWPDQYRFKRGDAAHRTWLCSWGHLRQYDKGKEGNYMARTKKDGTPAKRPGPKPKNADVPKPIAGGDWEKIQAPEANLKLDGAVRIETPEAKNVKVVEVPEKPAKKPIEYKVTGIQTEVGEFWIVREGKIKWVPGRLAKEDPVMQVMWPEAEPALVPEMWRRFAEIILYVLDLLEVEP